MKLIEIFFLAWEMQAYEKCWTKIKCIITRVAHQRGIQVCYILIFFLFVDFILDVNRTVPVDTN